MPSDISSTTQTDSDSVASQALPLDNEGETNSRSPVSSDRDGAVGVPRTQVDWYRSTPWWRLISQSVHISWRSSHLFVCLVAIGLSALSWQACMVCFSPEFAEVVPAQVTAIPGASVGVNTASETWLWAAFFSPLPELRSYMTSIFRSEPWTIRKVAFGVTYVLSMIAVWGFAGGLIARRSVMEFGVRTSVGWIPSFKLVLARWRSIVWSILMPLATVAMLALIPLVLGYVSRAGGIGQTIALLAAFPCMLVMLGMGWIIAIAGLGFPLSVCAIVSEKGADAFDGLSRAAAYLFQRPMSVLCILIVASSVGTLGFWVFDFLMDCGETVFLAAMSVGFGGDFLKVVSNGPTTLQGSIFDSLQSVLSSLRTAYVISFFWTATAAAYLTLRWEIDHTDFDDLDLQELGEPVAIPKITEESVESEKG